MNINILVLSIFQYNHLKHILWNLRCLSDVYSIYIVYEIQEGFNMSTGSTELTSRRECYTKKKHVLNLN